MKSDLIVVFDNGNITQTGTFQQLSKNKKFTEDYRTYKKESILIDF